MKEWSKQSLGCSQRYEGVYMGSWKLPISTARYLVGQSLGINQHSLQPVYYWAAECPPTTAPVAYPNASGRFFRLGPT